MALNLKVKEEVSQNLEKYEGRVVHLYLDTVGKVTVGIGHMIPSVSFMSKIPMYKINSKKVAELATIEEKRKEYEEIKSKPYGKPYGSSSFRKYTSLFMIDSDIDLEKEKHLNDFYFDLFNHYSTSNGYKTSFDSMPESVQKALFDLVFNLGITRLKSQYKKFNAFIKIEDWRGAAGESKRVGISDERNSYVRDLLNSTPMPVAEAANAESQP